MNRRSLPIATALTAAAALLLTACGGEEGKPKANDKIAGVDKGETASTPTTATSSPAIERPEIKLPKDVTETFEGWKTGDSTKDAILTDASRAQSAVTYAVTQGNPDEPSLAFYQQGDALVGSLNWVKEIVDMGTTFTGSVRYYAPKIEVFDGKTAGVVYCSDESKAYNKDRKSGKVDESPATSNSYVLYSTRLEKSDQGIWQTTKLISKRGSDGCTQ
ncbi:hypothetical protein ACFWOJ_39305 [Streptomyces sp. NPDC058439]|uniref:hypothetical protein n=1 Tax=Streptomyces sp. NPDC058439 TaxID=3346500 RepID=UPI0036567132